ncbi:SRPBCC family protein [Streptomyces sp. NPDC016469]|uniref:SRPBCC family protein n=1 Tax=Streptomyces sp. NPDC016469 TaxID=3157191 RepID=UPI0033CA47BD
MDLMEALMPLALLPYIDEHETVIEAAADDVWRGLSETLDRSFAGPGATACARLVGATDRTPSGPRPLTEDATLPGFRVTTATPPHELALSGRHRFSTYTLTFRLDELSPTRSRLRAESRAAFPGPAGGAYRRLVITTGGHALGMRRLLRAIRHCSEQPPAANGPGPPGKRPSRTRFGCPYNLSALPEVWNG